MNVVPERFQKYLEIGWVRVVVGLLMAVWIYYVAAMALGLITGNQPVSDSLAAGLLVYLMSYDASLPKPKRSAARRKAFLFAAAFTVIIHLMT